MKFETTKGDFTLEVHPEWSPNGAARFKELIEKKYYDECRFFRVVPGFVVQWGMNGDPKVNAEWSEKNFKDDPVKASNTKGLVTYAKSGRPNSRTTQLFINLGDNARLDEIDFAPFAKVTKGMKVVESLNAEYREQPDQGRIKESGNEYLKENFPRLDSIKTARIVKPKKDGGKDKKEDKKEKATE
ncbi:MAG: peptidylprolyl isomerase [Planctomycetes bacterium]|nr:peptidylprolyl isomerase [Planctomycetota bacterium]